MLTDISTESVNAILPKYLVLVVGFSPQAFGVVNGLYQGVSALVRLLGGWIGDRTDRPKWVAFAGYGVSAVSRVGLLATGQFAAISLIVTGDRLGKGLRTAPRDSLIAAASKPETLGRAYGTHRALDSLGAALGPLMAFAVLSMVADGFHAVFVVSLAFAVIGVAVLCLIVPDLRIRATPSTAPDARLSGRTPLDLRLLVNRRLFLLVVVAAVLGLCTVGDAFLYLDLQLRDDLANNYYALLMVVMNAAYLVLAVPLGRLADRVGRARLFVAGQVALLLCYLFAAGPMAGAPASLLTLVLLGAYYAATDGTLAALAGRTVEPALRGSAIAAAQTSLAGASFLSSLLVGLLWAHFGLRTAILSLGVPLFFAIPACAVILRRVDRDRLRAATVG